jgi:hypothetical protein
MNGDPLALMHACMHALMHKELCQIEIRCNNLVIHGLKEAPEGHGLKEAPEGHGLKEAPEGHGLKEAPEGHGLKEAPLGERNNEQMKKFNLATEPGEELDYQVGLSSTCIHG